MSVSIKYKGAEIASANTEVTKTIKTAGKYCEADILVENTPDSGDAPVINPLSVTANGTYTAPSGVDGYSPVTVNVPQGITPTGNINITDTNVTDVTNYATAQVISENLKPENVKKDIDILGILGTFAGGGGGSLPSSITKIDGGSFTLATNTDPKTYSWSHNLGVIPRIVTVWCDELTTVTPYSVPVVIDILAAVYDTQYTATSSKSAMIYTDARKADGTMSYGLTNINLGQLSSWITTSTIKMNVNFNYKAGATYKWVAYA